MDVEDIIVFIPSKDYELSKRFYLDLGFEMVFETEEVSEFQSGECAFLLQNFYNEELANNLMMQLVVTSLDAAQVKIESMDQRHFKFKPPQDVPWGRVIYLWGPSGELWHITEFSD